MASLHSKLTLHIPNSLETHPLLIVSTPDYPAYQLKVVWLFVGSIETYTCMFSIQGFLVIIHKIMFILDSNIRSNYWVMLSPSVSQLVSMVFTINSWIYQYLSSNWIHVRLHKLHKVMESPWTCACHLDDNYIHDRNQLYTSVPAVSRSKSGPRNSRQKHQTTLSR